GAVFEVVFRRGRSADAEDRTTTAVHAVRELDKHRIVTPKVALSFAAHPQAIIDSRGRVERHLEIVCRVCKSDSALRRARVRVGDPAATRSRTVSHGRPRTGSHRRFSGPKHDLTRGRLLRCRRGCRRWCGRWCWRRSRSRGWSRGWRWSWCRSRWGRTTCRSETPGLPTRRNIRHRLSDDAPEIRRAGIQRDRDRYRFRHTIVDRSGIEPWLPWSGATLIRAGVSNKQRRI